MSTSLFVLFVVVGCAVIFPRRDAGGNWLVLRRAAKKRLRFLLDD